MSSVENMSGNRNAALISGGLLVVAAMAALWCANSGLAEAYARALETRFAITLGNASLSKPILLWINDGLMALFFLLVGLEIKREALAGELNSAAKAALPVIGGLGGFLVPALIYSAINFGSPENLRGWAIPAATDIAFAIGIATMLGRAVPLSLKTFLLALAIIDDLMAIVVIAIFYTAQLSWISLALAAVGLLALTILNQRNVQDATPYVLVGLFTWMCVLQSGVHATLAGVAVGLAMPLSSPDGRTGLLERAEHALQPWVGYLVIPIFAFANAGVPLGGITLSNITSPLPLGIALGLMMGKPLGIFGAVWLALRLRVAPLPEGASLAQVYGIATLAGIGFTMSLFIGSLAFEDAQHMTLVRLGVLIGSTISAAMAVCILLLSRSAVR